MSFSEDASTGETVLADRIGCVKLRSGKEAPVRRECRMRDAMGFDAFPRLPDSEKKKKVDLISCWKPFWKDERIVTAETSLS